MRRWQQIKRGDGSVVLISGEAGVKSRLAETVVERLSDDPHIPLRRFCSPHHQDSALSPTISQLVKLCDGLRDPAARAILAVADPHAASLGHLALTLALLGYLDQGRARADEALSEARRLDHPFTVAFGVDKGVCGRGRPPACRMTPGGTRRS